MVIWNGWPRTEFPQKQIYEGNPQGTRRRQRPRTKVEGRRVLDGFRYIGDLLEKAIAGGKDRNAFVDQTSYLNTNVCAYSNIRRIHLLCHMIATLG